MRSSLRIALIAAAAALLLRLALETVVEETRAPAAQGLASRAAGTMPALSPPPRASGSERARGAVPAGAAQGRGRRGGTLLPAGGVDEDRAGAASAPEASAARAEVAARLPPPRPDPPEAGAGAVTTGITGWDPAAPRELTLWRVGEGRIARLAGTHSERGGRFRFPEVALGGAELAVTAAGAEPDAGDPRLHPPQLEPGPPPAWLLPAAEGTTRLRIAPSAGAASVVVAAAGREIARQPVPERPDGGRRTLELVLPAAGATLWVAEERSGGVRSGWRAIEPGPPAEDATGEPVPPEAAGDPVTSGRE